MSRIVVFYTDGTQEVFEETSRPGGSYCTSHKYENGFLVIKDAWGKETGIPENRIKRIDATPTRY